MVWTYMFVCTYMEVSMIGMDGGMEWSNSTISINLYIYLCNLNQDCLIDSPPYSQRMGLSYIPTIRSRLPLKIERTIMWGQVRTSARAVRRHHLPLPRKMPTWPDVGIMAAINFIKKKKILTTHVNTIPVSRIYASIYVCMYVCLYMYLSVSM